MTTEKPKLQLSQWAGNFEKKNGFLIDNYEVGQIFTSINVNTSTHGHN